MRSRWLLVDVLIVRAVCVFVFGVRAQHVGEGEGGGLCERVWKVHAFEEYYRTRTRTHDPIQ